MISKTIPVTPPSVVAQIASLPDMSMEEIRALWRRLFHKDAPTYVRAFLERRIAYKLQEIEFRKVDRNLLERNQRRIQALIEKGSPIRRDQDYRPVAGTVLTREFRGVEYQVVVTADGDYAFEGRRYTSLSRIAREITGTRWSGPVFFGLKASGKSKKRSKKL